MVQASNTPISNVEKSLNFPVGAFSPLWLAFAGAAATGAAYFWMSRWVRPTNLATTLEAKLAAEIPAAPPIPKAPVPEVISTTEAVMQAAVATIEPMMDIAQAATETVIHSAIEQSAALAEALDPVEPVVDAAMALETLEDPNVVLKAVTDDLTRLVGIGPKLAASLAERGVTRFAQLAAFTSKDLEEIDEALSLKGRAVRDAWVAQARRFAESAA